MGRAGVSHNSDRRGLPVNTSVGRKMSDISSAPMVIEEPVSNKMTQEQREVADAYIVSGMDLDKTELYLQNIGVTLDICDISEIISLGKVQHYITLRQNSTGLRNPNHFFELMQSMIEKKMEELEEADITTSKDILEIMESFHSMKMKEEQLAIKRLELEVKRDIGKAQKITNTQLNVGNDAIGGLPKVLESILRS